MDVELSSRVVEQEGREIPVDVPEFGIGCDQGCLLRVNDKVVGLRDRRIAPGDERVLVEDRGAGGTEVNGRSSRAVGVRPSAPPTSPTEAPRRVRLLVLTGKARGRFVAVGVPRFLIGRDSSCHLRAHSEWVSRNHACIEQRGDRVFVRDLGSTNGTFLDGRRLQDEEAEVTEGARLEVGPLQFRVALATGWAARDTCRPVSRSALQFTCTFQPGSLVHLFEDSDPRTDSTPLRATARHHASRGPDAPPHGGPMCPRCGTEEAPALERLLRELLLALGRGASDPTAAVSIPTDPPCPVAADPPATPAALDSCASVVTQRSALPALRSSGGPTARDGPWDLNQGALLEGLSQEMADGSAPGLPGHADMPSDEARLCPLEPRPSPPAHRPRELEIDFECPGCGTSGRAPVSRLDRQLSCKVCRASFRVTASGEAIVARRHRMTPDHDRDRAHPSDVAAHHDHARTSSPVTPRGRDRVERLFDSLVDLSRTQWVTAVLMLLLIVLTARWVVARFGESPRSRTFRVVEAVTRNQAKRLAAFSVPRGSGQAVQWMQLIGPGLKRQIERGARTEVKVVLQDHQVAKTTVAVHPLQSGAASPRQTSSAAVPGRSGWGGPTRLTLFWVRSPRGDWLLDGSRTYQYASERLGPDPARPHQSPRSRRRAGPLSLVH